MTAWWLGTAWSESVWTWLNNALGQNLALASDLEFVLAIGLAFNLSFTGLLLLTHLVQRWLKAPPPAFGSVLGLAGRTFIDCFLVLGTAYLLLWVCNAVGITPQPGTAAVAFTLGIACAAALVFITRKALAWLWLRFTAYRQASPFR